MEEGESEVHSRFIGIRTYRFARLPPSFHCSARGPALKKGNVPDGVCYFKRSQDLAAADGEKGLSR